MYGPKRGFAQSEYFDQQATALAGMLANASDINLTDSAFVVTDDAVNGLEAGIGVVALPTTASPRAGVNYDRIMAPTASAADADFAGIVVRNQVMRTNPKGEACWYEGDMANYARRGRAGSRIWVKLANGTATPNGKVYWIVSDVAGTGKTIGAFSASAISVSGSATAAKLTGGSINLTALKAVSTGGLDITIDGTNKKLSALDFSAVASLDDVVSALNTALTGVATVSALGAGIVITSATTGTSSTMAYAVAPTTAGQTDVSAALGLTAASGGVLAQGTSGASYDTVELTNARFVDTFEGGNGANNIALVELM